VTIQLRPYQLELKASVYKHWAAGLPNVLMRLDTGGGKTAILADIVSEHVGASCVIAHRHELVSQLSLMLARYGVRHNIIASAGNCRAIADLHVKETGRNYYDPSAPCAVASVDTLVKRKDLAVWAAQVTLAIVDEGHHVVLDNKWHRALQLFTSKHLRVLLPTATPKRADGKGLGRAPLADGVADVMVEGPLMRWLIEQGYLTDYAPPICAESHLTDALGKPGDSGDWSTVQLRAAVEASGNQIVGDVVKTYLKHAAGKLAIVFASDVKTATEMLQAYRAAGIAAELITGETDPGVRRHIIHQFEARKVHVLIAVDIVSEGFDLPAIECVIFARTTASLAIFMQQFGRVLRPIYAAGFDLATQAGRLAAIAASCKPVALVIDHVGNFMRHRPPDRAREWTLERTGRRSNGPSEAIPMRACLNPECAHPYERIHYECPYCGTPAPPPADRSSPAMVDGDMVMMDAEVLAALRGEVDAISVTLDEYRHKLAASGLPQRFILANAKHHHAKLQAQEALYSVMAWWGGMRKAEGLDDRQMQRLFFLRFGVDVLTARTLKPDDAEELMGKIAVDAA